MVFVLILQGLKQTSFLWNLSTQCRGQAGTSGFRSFRKKAQNYLGPSDFLFIKKLYHVYSNSFTTALYSSFPEPTECQKEMCLFGMDNE